MIERCELLISQGKFESAYQMAKDGLSTMPNSSRLLTILATCALYTKRVDESYDLVTDLIYQYPSDPYNYYLKAHIHLEKSELEEALKELREAMSLDPTNSVYHELKANIFFHQKKYYKAEKAAKTSLAIDGQNMEAVNTLARIYNAQGKREESEILLDKILSLDPENVDSHANYGMQSLETGDVNKAIEHFQQALFKEPTNEYAQYGMKLAMKAKFPLYSWLLRFQFFMSKQSSQVNFLLIIGIIVLSRSIRKLTELIGGIAEPIGYTLIGILFLIVLSTWILDPIMTFVLYTRKNGRLSLSENELKQAKFVGLQLAILGIGISMGIIVNTSFFNLIGVCVIGLITSNKIFGDYDSKKPQRIGMSFYGAGALFFTISAVLGLSGIEDISASILLLAILTTALYTWVGNSVWKN